MRVYELAKEYKLPPQKLLDILAQLGFKGKTSLSSLSREEVAKVRERLAKKGTEERKKKKKLLSRPPVVAFLGHVDHGKTSLLDAIRNTRVAQKEVGGITQHIGASEIEFQGKRIVFIDTPGHEVFTGMRAQGAQVTDLVVLVVAADDGVMPQTVEAINHARAAGVPIMVAINKIDKKEAQIERTKRQLTEQGLVPEEWGGDTVFVEVSALTKQGLNDLLELIILQAELLELKADPEGELQAVVIEGELDKYMGPVCTLLVQEGTLRIGDVLAGGNSFGKVRALINWKGERVKEAGPSTPVRVLGFSRVPRPGEKFKRIKDEKTAREIAEKKEEEMRQKSLQPRKSFTLEDFYRGEEKVLRLILKADTQGTLLAVEGSLKKLEEEDLKLNILHSGVGEPNKSDVLLASASRAIIVAFGVSVPSQVKNLAEEEGVEIRVYQVIYKLLEEMKKAIKGLLKPEWVEEIVGRAEVRQVFRISRVGNVAGAYVREGRVLKGKKAKVLRNDSVIGEGEIVSLRRFEKDVVEVTQGFECGIKIGGVEDIKVGDIIEIYEKKREDLRNGGGYPPGES